MSHGKKIFIFIVTVSFVVIMLAAPAPASVFSGKNRYVVSSNDTLDDDLYLGTGEGVFDGVVTGDIVIGAQKYVVSGQVLGNVNGASRSATIRGTVGKSARIFAQTVIVNGTIGGNLLAFASDIEMSRNSRIYKDAAIFGNEVSIAGQIDRDLIVKCGQVVISGRIGGDLDLKGNKISIVAPAEIVGDITYTSRQKIRIEDDVIIGGEVTWKRIRKAEDEDGGINWVLRFIFFLCSLTTGLILIGLFNRHARISADRIVKKPLASLGIGFVAFCAIPIAFVVLLVLIVGIPAAIMLLFAYTVIFYVAKIYVAIAVGRLGFRAFRKSAQPAMGWCLLFGLIILSLLFTVPVLGVISYFAVLFWGIGGILLGIKECRWMPPPPEAASSAQPPVSPVG